MLAVKSCGICFARMSLVMIAHAQNTERSTFFAQRKLLKLCWRNIAYRHAKTLSPDDTGEGSS